MRRMVVVQGQRFDLERAVEVLAGSDVRIVGEDDGFFLEAPEVSEAADAADARRIAEGITLRLAGMLRLEFTLVSPITVGSVVEIEDDGSRRIHGSEMPQAATLVLHMGRPVVSISGGKPAPPYKIIDAVRDTMDGKNDRKLKAWIPELDRIGGTANARETALEGGRHATKRYSLSKAKKGRIPLDEAWSAVTRLVDEWLRWRPQVVPAKPDCEPPAE
jgi:hypothetical protein